MTRYIDADYFLKEYCEPYPNVYAAMSAAIKHMPTVDAIPIKWLYEQSDNPDRSDRFRNACDLVAMTWLEERGKKNDC